MISYFKGRYYTVGKTIITFSSVTYSMKAKKALARIGIDSKLVKISGNTGEGCKHGIEINNNAFLDAINSLRYLGIEYSVYNP